MADDYSMSDFVTPGQVEAQRAMAKALLAQSFHTPVGREHEAVSPFAIGAQMTQALMGRMGMDQAGQQERASVLGGVRTKPEAPGSPTGGLVPRVGEDATDPEGRALSSLESGGKYNALGPIIKKGPMAGDRAYGKYQIMGSNIPKWTQEFLGHQMTPGEFLNNPEAQEAVRKGKFAQYEQQFGPEGAARAWLGGPGGVNYPERADQLGTTIGQYGQNYMTRLASNAPVTPDTSPQGGQALAYAAEPDAAATEAPDAPAAVSKALAGEDPVRVAGGPKASAPGGVGGAVPAGAAQARPHMSRQQFERGIADARARGDTAAEEYLTQIYMSQHAPVQIMGPYGQPGYQLESGETRYYPGPPQMVPYSRQLGPMKKSGSEPMWTYGPPAAPGGPPTIIRGGGQGQERPPAVPGPTTPIAPTETPLDLSTPEEGKPGTGKGSQAEGGAKYAALTTGDTMTDAGPGPAGPLAVAPPTTPDIGGTGRPVIPTESPPGPTTKVAQAGGDFTPEEVETALSYETEQKRRGQAAEHSEKQLADYGDSAKRLLESTNRLKQQIHESRDLVESGLPIMGPMARTKRWWNEFLAAGENPEALARVSATEAMEKNIASEVLADMKTQLEKMGQVRIAEIDLLKTAMANPNITPRANMAILKTLEDYANVAEKVAKITEQYEKGIRWNDKGKPIVDKDGRAVLAKAGTANELRDTIAGFVQRSPLYTTLKSKEYLNTIDPDGVIRAKMKGREEMEKRVQSEKAKRAEPKVEPKVEQPQKQFVPGPAKPPGFE